MAGTARWQGYQAQLVAPGLEGEFLEEKELEKYRSATAGLWRASCA